MFEALFGSKANKLPEPTPEELRAWVATVEKSNYAKERMFARLLHDLDSQAPVLKEKHYHQKLVALFYRYQNTGR